MTPVKRIEIVVGAVELDRLVDALEGIGVADYTLLRDVDGRGSRGERHGDEISDAFRNAVLVVAIDPAQAERVVETVRPFLRRYGGMCLLSDALWVKH